MEPACGFGVDTEPSISVFSRPSPGAPTTMSLTPSPLKSATTLGWDEHGICPTEAGLAAMAERPTGSSATSSPTTQTRAIRRRFIGRSLMYRSPLVWAVLPDRDGPPGALYTSARSRGTTSGGRWFGSAAPVYAVPRGESGLDGVQPPGPLAQRAHGRRVRHGQARGRRR